MLPDLEAFFRYVTLIAVRFYLLTYLLSVYRPGITAHIKLQIFLSSKTLNTNLKVGYLKCQGERKLEGLYTSV